MSDFEKFNPKEFIQNLRILADARGPVPDDESDAWRAIRRERLAKLEVDPEHARLALAGERCPVLPSHAGSRAASSAAERFVSDQKFRLLLFGGPTGRGKSVAATWVAACLEGSAWISAKDVRVGDAWAQAYTRALKALVLVIDDLGQEASEWAGKELGSLIESRYDKGRRTVITTNLPLATVVKVYGDRLASRLSRVGASEYVVCGGSDLRREEQ